MEHDTNVWYNKHRMTGAIASWVLVLLLFSLVPLTLVAYAQHRFLNRYTRTKEMLASALLEHQQLFSMVQEQAMISQRGADQMLLIARTLEWRRSHDLSEFNELVMWQLAEDLAIDRTLASELYDKLTKRSAEDPDAA
jgi:uncharacterized iron-regulated membrane protein